MSDQSKFVRIRNADRWGQGRCSGRGRVRGTRSDALRYSAQLNAYLYLLTGEYPHASPLEGAESQLSFDDTA